MAMNKHLTAVIGDMHIPHHSADAVNWALSRIREEKPQRIVLLGDIMDFDGIARFPRTLDRKAAFKNEIATGKEWFKKFAQVWRNKEVTFLSGNHESLAENTLVLCDDGWKAARDVTEADMVASFDMGTGELTYAFPLAVSKHMASSHAVVSSSEKHETVTQNHALIVDGHRRLVEDLPGKLGGNKFMYHLPSQGQGVGLSNNYIRFLVWCLSDGCLYKAGPNKVRIQFKLSKKRKIERLREVLDACRINYTFKKRKKYGLNKLQPYYIRIYGSDAVEMFDLIGAEKKLPRWITCLDKEQTDTFFDELLITDGNKHYNQNCITTTSEYNADMIQLLAVINERHCTIDEVKYGSGFLTGKVQYRLRVGMRNNVYQRVEIKKSDIAIPVVSITTVDDTLITRENGKVNFTGNSRLSKYIIRNAPAVCGLPNIALRQVLNIPNSWRVYPYNLNAISVDGVKIIHGRKYSDTVCIRNLRKYMSSVIQGHSHRASAVYRRHNGKILGGLEIGCLCDLHPDYAADVDWIHAMGWVEDGYPILELK